MEGFRDLLTEEDLHQLIEDCGSYASLKVVSANAHELLPENNLPHGELSLYLEGETGERIEILFRDVICWKLDVKPVDGIVLENCVPGLLLFTICHPGTDIQKRAETSSWFMAKSIHWRIVPKGE